MKVAPLRLANGKKLKPKDTSVVECQVHGTKTTWGALDDLQRVALEEGIDTAAHLPCLLAPRSG